MDLNKILKDVRRVTADSRNTFKGDMFIALRGYSVDSHKFIGEAISKGAGIIVAEEDFNAPDGVKKIIVGDTRAVLSAIADKFYGHPSRKLKVIGVTGTNGKTTITYIIESILNCARKKTGVIGTINYRFDGKVMHAKNTTPGPIELQSMLADMVEASCSYAAMEVSSHSLDQRRPDGIELAAAIFTNITPEHLDYHKTPEAYFDAKTKIFGYLKESGAAILNNDDSRVRTLKNAGGKKIVTYGIKEKADITAKNIRLSPDSSKFDIVLQDKSLSVSTRLIGMYNVSNILAAAAACDYLGIKPAAIKKGIEQMTFVPGRLEPVGDFGGFKVFVDFAHTEDALRNVLGLLKEVSGGRIITVFGCGGNRDRKKRPAMGRAACELSGHVVITSDNPRFEDPSDIISEITRDIRGKFSNYEVEVDRRRAIDKALSLAEAGSIVIIAGKGHEKTQIIGDKALPFDDREVVKEILKNAN